MPRPKKTPAQLDAEIAIALAKASRPMNGKDADFFTRSSGDNAARQKAMHQALLTWPAFIVTDTSGRRTLLIHSGEMSNPEEGSHRVTKFGPDGPEGHIVRRSVLRLAQDLARDIYPAKLKEATEAQVIAWMSSPEYIEGAERVLEAQRWNERR